MPDPTDPPDESVLDKAAEHLAHSHTAVEAGNILMPNFARHASELVDDLDAEAAADKTMLAEFPKALHDHGPLESAGVDLAAIKTLDAGFDDEAFMSIARETFIKVREARSLENPAEGDALLSAAMASDLHTAIDGDVASHRHHLLPLLDIASAAIVSTAVDGAREVIGVRFHLTGEEVDRDDNGAVVAGDTTLHQWDEDWRFERDPSIDTSVNDEKHILAFDDNWMVAHRGWVVTAIERVTPTAALST